MQSELREWLRSLELEHLTSMFEEHQVDFRDLPLLTDEDLKEMGLALGPRKRVLKAITELARNDETQVAPAHDAHHRAIDAERRQLTVMFVDLVDSTTLSAQLDPEDMRDVIRSFQDTSAGIITRFDGYVAKYLGDGLLAYFGWPRAQEDSAERACRAALELASAIGELKPRPALNLQVRIGIATGLVVVGDLIGEGASQEETVVGDTPNLAARLQTLATPNSVIIAPTTARLTEGVLVLRSLGPRRLKGLTDPVEAFQIMGSRSSVIRFEARSGQTLLPMIGRQQELALLLERWAQAKTGEGQGVLLIGEAGIGKSRIARAVLDAVAKEPHTRIRYQCSPYHTESALWPVIQQLGHAARLTGSEQPDDALDKLERLLALADDDGIRAVPLIADLLGLRHESRYETPKLTPQAQRAQTLRVLVEQLLGLSVKQPVLLLIEDVHWIDPTTLELVEAMLDQTATARVLIVLTSRPEHQPELAGHPHVTRLTLNRLVRKEVESIVRRLGSEELSINLVDTIIARSDGVPLFVEELTKAIIETGDSNIPVSLHDSLMARLDRIPDVREVAQLAACIGREFDYQMLSSICEIPDEQLQSALERLDRSELVFRRGSYPATTYIFKHALVQDAAYASLLRSRRIEVHKAIFKQLEQADGTDPEVLAHHAQRAHLNEKAIRCWNSAAIAAANRSAYREAVNRHKNALQILEQMPDQADLLELGIDIRLSLRNSYVPLGEPGNALQFVREAALLAEETGDINRQALAASYQCNLLWHLGRSKDAVKLGRQAVERALQSDQIELVISSKFFLGQVCHALGDLDTTNDLYREVIDICDCEDPYSQFGLPFLPASHARAWLALTLAELGRFDEGENLGARAIQIAEKADQPFSRQQAYWGLGSLYLRQGKLDDAEQLLNRAMAVTHEWSLNIWGAPIKSTIGRLKLLSDRAEDGLELLEQAIDEMDRTNSSATWLAPALISLADAYKHCRRLDDATATIRRALKLARRQSQKGDICRALYVLGTITCEVRRGSTTEAVREFDEALALARRMRMVPMEAHINCELANIARKQGDQENSARQMKLAMEQYNNLGMSFWAERLAN